MMNSNFYPDNPGRWKDLLGADRTEVALDEITCELSVRICNARYFRRISKRYCTNTVILGHIRRSFDCRSLQSLWA